MLEESTQACLPRSVRVAAYKCKACHCAQAMQARMHSQVEGMWADEALQKGIQAALAYRLVHGTACTQLADAPPRVQATEAMMRSQVEGEWADEALEDGIQASGSVATLRAIIAESPPSPRYIAYHDALLKRCA
jgi:hypothetical protein